MADKESFIVRKKYRKQIQKLSVEQKAKLTDGIFCYQSVWSYECDDMTVSILLDIMIEERENDNEKYEAVCEKNRENGLKWGRPKKNRTVISETQQNPTKPKKADIWYMIYDSDIWLHNTNNLISTKVDIEQSSNWNPEINNLISEIKQMCLGLGVAYDKQKERQFAKHILTAKEYWEFAEKIWQDRVTFALNVLKASFQIKFRKWICTWPMKIYQNYADVYNETLKQHAKQSKNLIQSF